MKKLSSIGLLLAVFTFMALQNAHAQSENAIDMFKKHINKVVQKVEKAHDPSVKREVLNDSFDDLLNSFARVENVKTLSSADQTAMNKLKNNITQKRNELNGLNGYKRVQNNQLNNFANFVQQDLEQADRTITISLTVLLLIVIILILL